MISTLAGFWVGLPKWAQDLLKIVGAALLIFLVGKAMAEALKAEGARKQREKQEREALEEMARVNDARLKATQENQNAADRADEAVRTMPRYLPDELRDKAPDVADIVLGPRGGGA